MSLADIPFAESLPDYLKTQAAALAESLNQCFDTALVLAPGPLETWDQCRSGIAGQAGVVCELSTANGGAIVLIPQSIGLPAWYRTPGESQLSRMNTLAMEWSINLFPGEVEVTEFRSIVSEELTKYSEMLAISPAATAVRMSVSSGTQYVADLVLVWPVDLTLAQQTPSTPAPAPATPPVSPGAAERASRPIDPLARLRKLPVTVSVRLTERRISVSQLLAITPGALLTFSKSCDDLLDLYVNNTLYCRGEAVKINECFGLKINEVGVRPERPSKVLEG